MTTTHRLLVAGIMLCVPSAAMPLEMRPRSIEMGVVAFDTGYVRHVQIANDSDGAVEIDSVISACGLRLDVPVKRIAPRSSAEAVLHLQTGLHPGTFGSTARIVYRDAAKERKDVTVDMHWEIKPPSYTAVSLERTEFDLGVIQAGRKAVVFLPVTNYGTQVARLRPVSLPDQFSMGAIEVRPGQMAFIPLTVLPRNTGSVETDVTLESDDPMGPRHRFKVSYRSIDEPDLKMSVLSEGVARGQVRIDGATPGGAHLVAIRDVAGRSLVPEGTLPRVIAGDGELVEIATPGIAGLNGTSYIYLTVGLEVGNPVAPSGKPAD